MPRKRARAPKRGLPRLRRARRIRTDPDVVMISTIDSAEVAQLAFEAANRGMLVFAAIDAKNASSAIEKLLSFDISPWLVAPNLLGVVGVQIAHKLGEDKKPGEKISREDGARLEQKADFGRVLAALKEESQIHEHTAWKDIVFYDSKKEGDISACKRYLR